jgi:hypothetical protein
MKAHVLLYLFEKEYLMADQLSPFREGSLWGFRETTGKTVISAQYDSAGSFSEGLARVKVNGKWGFVNTLGEMVISPQFDQARFFQGGQAKVQQGTIWGYIDVKGFFVDKLEAGSFIDKSGAFISEQEYQKWGKPPGSNGNEQT